MNTPGFCLANESQTLFHLHLIVIVKIPQRTPVCIFRHGVLCRELIWTAITSLRRIDNIYAFELFTFAFAFLRHPNASHNFYGTVLRFFFELNLSNRARTAQLTIVIKVPVHNRRSVRTNIPRMIFSHRNAGSSKQKSNSNNLPNHLYPPTTSFSCSISFALRGAVKI